MENVENVQVISLRKFEEMLSGTFDLPSTKFLDEPIYLFVHF